MSVRHIDWLVAGAIQVHSLHSSTHNDCANAEWRSLVRAVSTTSLKNNGMLMMESLRINEIEPKNLKKEVIFYEISELIVLSGNGIQASTSFIPVPIETGIEVK